MYRVIVDTKLPSAFRTHSFYGASLVDVRYDPEREALEFVLTTPNEHFAEFFDVEVRRGDIPPTIVLKVESVVTNPIDSHAVVAALDAELPFDGDQCCWCGATTERLAVSGHLPGCAWVAAMDVLSAGAPPTSEPAPAAEERWTYRLKASARPR